MPRPFHSELVLEERISEATVRAYHVGFDQNRFRLQPLVDVIRSVIPEFALGLHDGDTTPNTELINRVVEAARLVYETEKYGQRGEFGELILHLLLREFCGTLPLVSKIYFKDSNNAPIHGFDGIHVTIEDKKLWLGESKLYANGADGIRDLVSDLIKHVQGDYLRREFTIVSRKLPASIPEIETWRTLMHRHTKLDQVYRSICIPLVCTYSSDLFASHTDATEQYFNDFNEECQRLHKQFLKARQSLKTDIEAFILLLPIPNKDYLVTELHQRLKAMQQI